MTINEFAALCKKYGIHPAIALERAELVALLKAKRYQEVEAYLLNNF